MPKDDLKNNIKLSEKEKEYLDKVKFYKSQADSLKDTAVKSLKKDSPQGKNPDIKVTDRLKNIKDLVIAKDGQKLGLKNDIKKFVKEQPADAAAALIEGGPKKMMGEAINQSTYEKIEQQASKAAIYEKIINQIKYEAGDRDPFAELRQKYKVSSQNSAVNRNKPQNLPKGKSKSSSQER